MACAAKSDSFAPPQHTRVGRPGSAAARAFAAAQREAVARLLAEHPHLEPLLDAERRHFEDPGEASGSSA